MIKDIDYHGWNALHLATGQVDLIIPRDVGPRVISASIGGGDNLFASQPAQLGGTEEDTWMIRGGHRLWHAPEHPVRTYVPDNSPVQVDASGDGQSLLVTQPTETGTGLQKQLRIEVLNATTFKVTHRLANEGLWPVRCSAWALTVMKGGGYGIVSLPAKGSHKESLLPNMALVPWSYTDLSHPVWKLRNEYIGIDSPEATESQKLGLTNYRGWCAYWQEAGTFVKWAQVFHGQPYPDLGCCFEAYTCDWMVELETLSPLVEIPLGGHIDHVEYWGFLKGLQKPVSDEVFENKFRPVIDHWLAHTRA